MSIAKYIEDIYFFEVNTKYISSNALKISVISRVHSTSEIADIRVKLLIFSTHEMKYIWYLPKKVNFLFILEESSDKRLAIAQSREKMLLPDVWQYHKFGKSAIARRLAIARSRRHCYCQTSGYSKISGKLLLPDTSAHDSIGKLYILSNFCVHLCTVVTVKMKILDSQMKNLTSFISVEQKYDK